MCAKIIQVRPNTHTHTHTHTHYKLFSQESRYTNQMTRSLPQPFKTSIPFIPFQQQPNHKTTSWEQNCQGRDNISSLESFNKTYSIKQITQSYKPYNSYLIPHYTLSITTCKIQTSFTQILQQKVTYYNWITKIPHMEKEKKFNQNKCVNPKPKIK
jgi:hypothetical protein